MNRDYLFYRERVTERDFFEKIEENFDKIYDFTLEGKKYKIYYKENFGFLNVIKNMNEIRVRSITLKENNYSLEKKVHEMMENFGKINGKSSKFEDKERLKVFIQNHHKKF